MSVFVTVCVCFRLLLVFTELQGLNVQAEYKSPRPNERGDWYSTLGLHFLHSTQTEAVSTESTSSVADQVSSSVWLHLECEKEDAELVNVHRRFAREHSIMG